MNSSTQNNANFCYDLPIAIGNKTFCGLTEKWTPRFNHGALLAMTITPVLVYWLILFKMAKQLFEALHLVWRWEKGMTKGGPNGREILKQCHEQLYPGLETTFKISFDKWQKHPRWRRDEEDEYLEGVRLLFDDTPNHFVEKLRSFSTALKQSNQTGILFSLKSYFSLIILVFLKYFWDAIDLTLDVYIFYRLERGDVLDDVIYRNMHVNN